MASVQAGAVRRQIQRLFGLGPVAGLGDGQLLERYAIDRDEAAFEAIVSLHGPMVLAVCRRMLLDPEDAEDAFQATFLVLIRRAGSLGPAIALGPWLYGVACRVALRARSVAARHRSRERPVAGTLDVAASEGRPMSDQREVRAAIDGELIRLPSAYRAIVVLCDLEGRTHAEAARQLGWPIGTVKGRLARARVLLRSRLVRLGLAPSAAGLSALLGPEAAAAVPAGWLAITIEAARRAAAGEAVAGVVPATTIVLAEGVVQAMKLQRLQAIGAAGAMIVALAVGAGAVAQGVGDRKGAATNAAQPATGASPASVAGALPFTAGGGDCPRPKDPSNGRSIGDEKRHRAILAQLEEPLTMSFPQDTPLEDLLKYIKQVTQREGSGLPRGIPIYVDPVGLQEAEKTLTSTVSLDLDGVPLKRTLFLALKQIGLTYHVVDGLLIITSADSDDPTLFAPEPGAPFPMKVMQRKAERGEMTPEERKEYLLLLKDLKDIHKALHDIEDAQMRQDTSTGESPPGTPTPARAVRPQ